MSSEKASWILRIAYIELKRKIDSGRDSIIRCFDKKSKGSDSVSTMQPLVGSCENDLATDRCNITVGEICDIIDVNIPAEYNSLANVQIGKICSRSSEVKPGDVLFLLEQYHDTNDKKARAWILRKRVASVSKKKGAIFVFSHRALPKSIPHVVVNNSREAHIKVCAELRKRYNTKVIGITGSVGKTSTKDLLYQVFKCEYNTGRSLRNSNAQVHIGLHIQEFSNDQRFFIQEMDGSRQGSASRHARMVLPDACVITNIGTAHVGNFGSQENILLGKLGIIDGMCAGGTLFINWDDPLLVRVDKKRLSTISDAQDELDKCIYKTIKDINVMSYGVNNHNADYYADNIVEKGGQMHFDIVDGQKRVRAVLNVRGEYNVLNAVCCYAVGKKYNISDRKIIEGILNFRTSGVRQNLISVGGYKLFVDCFNSSPPSVEASLSVLDLIQTAGKKIAVIGDITGADELVGEVHREVGEIVKNHRPDVVVCYGESSKIVYEMVKDNFEEVHHFTQESKLNEFLQKRVNVGDVVLFKGSSKMHLSEIIDENYGTMLSDQCYIDTVKYKELKQSGVTYYLYETYATAVKGHCTTGQTMKIAKHILGLQVCNLGQEAFCNTEGLASIIVPEGVRHIGESCFERCEHLKNVMTPGTLKYIAPSAFKKCESLNKITLNEGLIHIGEKAFKQCRNLKKIEIPSSVTEIGKDAFAGCDELKIYGKQGTYAEEYCTRNHIDFVIDSKT